LKILIAGDSFGADWTVKYNDYPGWPNLLAKKYEVTNVAKASIGQYKILKQLIEQDLNKFDTIIVCNTHPFRVHTRQHPLHSKDILHSNADLLLNDTFSHWNPFNLSLKAAKNFFLYHWDEQHALDIYRLIAQEQERILDELNVIHLKNFKDVDVISKHHTIDTTQLQGGIINHKDKTGNEIIYRDIDKRLTNSIDMLY